MAFFSWFSGRGRSSPAQSEDEASSGGFARGDVTTPLVPRATPADAVTKPAASAPSEAGDGAGTRRGERSARRELLYNVVRQSMMRAGILSASYKFKVLSLDARGRQFLIMVDLAREVGGDTTRLAEIEALIAQAAKARHDIAVSSVYWRMNEHVALGVPLTPRPVPRMVENGDPTIRIARPLASRPALSTTSSLGAVPAQAIPEPSDAGDPSATASSATIAAETPPVAAPIATMPAVKGRFEPIQDDEVAAFRRALQAGLTQPTQPIALRAPSVTTAGAAAGVFGIAASREGVVAPRASKPAIPDPAPEAGEKRGERNYTLLTGFEDTEMPAGAEMPALSETQYGGLN